MLFSDYMRAWLYGEGGYYTNKDTIGKEGDFYTAVSASRFFGGSIANRFLKTLDEGFLPEKTAIVEIGAHRGYLLADLIQFLYTLRPKCLDSLSFFIVEPLPWMQVMQQHYLHQSFGDRITVHHAQSLDGLRLDSAFILANELFDAFPCELYHEGRIARVKNHEISFTEESPAIHAVAERYGIQKGEIATGIDVFCADLGKTADALEFITFDYGQKRHRDCFTARIYQHHSTLPLFDEKLDLKQAYQKSDLTYDVHFDYLSDSMRETGMECVSFLFQNDALVEFGIHDLLRILHQHVDERTYLQEVNKIKTLIDPHLMGERFKMARYRKEK